jgi:hypothetical protein
VEIVYGGPTNLDARADYVVLRQSLQPEMLYGFQAMVPAPMGGRMAVSSSEVSAVKPGTTTPVPTGKTIWHGVLEQGGVYVAIESTTRTLLLDAARQLARTVAK